MAFVHESSMLLLVELMDTKLVGGLGTAKKQELLDHYENKKFLVTKTRNSILSV